KNEDADYQRWLNNQFTIYRSAIQLMTAVEARRSKNPALNPPGPGTPGTPGTPIPQGTP
ncbi:hypothetical protein BGZ65_012445, partial [Modicella reniformis]